MTQRRRRAQAIPEFAIVIPLFLLLIFAMIDFSRLLFTYVSMTNGAREMGRVISLTGPWVANHAQDTSNTVAAFNNLTIFGGAPSGVQNFSMSPGTGTISCSSMSSSGCGIQFGVNYSTSTISLTPISGAGASGSASTTFTGTAVPELGTLGVSADGDYVSVLLIEEGTSVTNAPAGFLQVCPLPVTTSCVLSNLSMWNGGGGIVEVDSSYTFHYSPLFQNKLTGVIDVSFTRALSLLTTTTRTTGE